MDISLVLVPISAVYFCYLLDVLQEKLKAWWPSDNFVDWKLLEVSLMTVILQSSTGYMTPPYMDFCALIHKALGTVIPIHTTPLIATRSNVCNIWLKFNIGAVSYV